MIFSMEEKAQIIVQYYSNCSSAAIQRWFQRTMGRKTPQGNEILRQDTCFPQRSLQPTEEAMEDQDIPRKQLEKYENYSSELQAQL